MFKKKSSEVAKKNAEFHKFSRLPSELRSMIIKHVCFFPRDVKVWELQHITARLLRHPVPERVQGRALDRLFSYVTYHSSLKPPSILQVSQEFRREALRWYALAFGTHVEANDVPMPNNIPAKIYFNWKADRLCIIDPSCIWRKYKFREFGLWDLCRENQLVSLAINCDIGLAGRSRVDMDIYIRFVANFVLYTGVKNLTLFSVDPQSRGSAFSLNPSVASGAPKDPRSPSICQKLDKFRTRLLRLCRTRGDADYGKQLTREVHEASIRPCIELARYEAW